MMPTASGVSNEGMTDDYTEAGIEMAQTLDKSLMYSPPDQQLRDGIPIHKIKCNDPFILYLRGALPADVIMDAESSGSGALNRYEMNLDSAAPVCISAKTAAILVDRGLDLVLFSHTDDAVQTAKAINTADDATDEYQLAKQIISDAIAAYQESDIDAITQTQSIAHYASIVDADGFVVAHGANPAVVGSDVSSLESTPPIDEIRSLLTEEGDETWAIYHFTNPVTNNVEPKRSLIVLYDEHFFISGYYMTPMQYHDEMARYALSDAITTYREAGLDALTQESVNPWYVFVVEPAGGTIVAHGQNPAFVGYVVNNTKSVPSSDELRLMLSERTQTIHDNPNRSDEIWLLWEFDNPVTGEYEYKRAVSFFYDGYLFIGPYPIDEETYRGLAE